MAAKITNKQLDEMISLLAGDDILPLVTLLKNKENVSEFKIAESLNITVNQVRNMLYRLYKHNLVEFTRKKDKKKGWYIYYWTLNLKNARDILINFKRKQLQDFRERLGQEEVEVFFVCPNRCKRLNLESAMEFDFKCQECGTLMDKQDNVRTIENIKQRIIELEEELKNEELIRQQEEEARKAKEKRKNKRAAKPQKKKVAKKVAIKKAPLKKPAIKKTAVKKPLPKKKKK
ncbi:hypothetical protein HY501_02300 [Candidatus Woesearchaeota archaeon]|nr:hypothetical protein [Candidatus Woesearchaeota archaeon]